MAKYDPITEADGWFTGEDKALQFTVYEEDGVTPQDITGYSLVWQLRVARDSPAAVLSKTDGSGIAIVNGPAGRCDVDVDRTDTDDLEPGSYYHQLARDDTGAHTVLTYGEAVLQRGIRP
jgi:hypothetical protein